MSFFWGDFNLRAQSNGFAVSNRNNIMLSHDNILMFSSSHLPNKCVFIENEY